MRILFLFAAVSCSLLANEVPQRLLWEIRTVGGPDRFHEMLPAPGGRLLAVRKGVLWAFDAQTGKQLWRYPEHDADIDSHRRPPFLLGIVGEHVITAPHGKLGRRGQGCLRIRLIDGAMESHFDAGLKDVDVMWKRLPSAQIAFWHADRNAKKSSVVAFDLAKWKELGRFDLPGIASEVEVCNGHALGVVYRDGEKFSRAFSVNLAGGELFSVPLRKEPEFHMHGFRTWPDGLRLIHGGLIDNTCAFIASWPWRKWPDVGGDGIVWEPLAARRVNPRDGKVLWTLDLPQLFRDVGYFTSHQIAASDGVAALLERNTAYIADAKNGTLRAGIRVIDEPPNHEGEIEYAKIACDDARVFFCWPGGLRVFSAHAVDKDRRDPNDHGDPAYRIRRCREALVSGEYQQAMHALSGVSLLLRLRPAERGEVTELLSQLSRSPAKASSPAVWERLMLEDGWTAGELFMDEYERLAPERSQAIAGLLAWRSKKALAIASKAGAGNRSQFGVSCLRALAAEILDGKWPLERMLNEKPLDWNTILSRPLDDETFAALVPQLRKISHSQLHYRLYTLPPKQVIAVLEGHASGPEEQKLLEAARGQLRAQERGGGEKETIQIIRPQEPVKPPAPPAEF